MYLVLRQAGQKLLHNSVEPFHNHLHFHLHLKKIMINPFPKKPGFHMSVVQTFWKHYGKRRNCLRQAISPFLTRFLYPFRELSVNLINLKLSSSNSFSLEESKICHLGKGWFIRWKIYMYFFFNISRDLNVCFCWSWTWIGSQICISLV